MKYLYLFRAHWQLVVLCPGDNVVVWFCSLKKKPDAAIKGAVNRLVLPLPCLNDIMHSYSKPPMIVMLCFYFENSAMKSVTKTAEGKPPQHGPQWIEAKVHVYLNSKCHMDVISVCVDWIHNVMCVRMSCRVMFKQEITSVDTMLCNGYGAS